MEPDVKLTDILPSRLGFGAAPLGNMFRAIPEDEARATVEAAWADGIRYFDTAPFYGAGLAEIRMGAALRDKPRDQYVISTKVGRLILDEVEEASARDNGEKGDVFKHGRPNKVVNDYSEDATYRSIEDSLKRVARLPLISTARPIWRSSSTASAAWASLTSITGSRLDFWLQPVTRAFKVSG